MDTFQILQRVSSILENLDIPFMLVGSFASTFHGRTRFTQDADLIVKMSKNQIEGFVQAFSGEFYVDRGLIEQAFANETSFNIIHFQSTFKVDFFILSRNSFHREEFSRRAKQQLDPETGFAAYLQTPEDSMLSKLKWYQQGGEISENQWKDVISILKAQAGRLDINYLEKWAAELEISDLLERAREVVGT
ncbi:MAG TPA: hypothetical protein VGV68_03550 [Terriglobia bacterium]|nr:hypothetical protein [Terriglobia bacterium]